MSALPIFDDSIQSEKDDGKKKLDALWEVAVELSSCDRDYLIGLKTKFPIQVRMWKSKAGLQICVSKCVDISDVHGKWWFNFKKK